MSNSKVPMNSENGTKSNVAIDVHGISKCFKILKKDWNIFSHLISFKKQSPFNDFWALSDISFSIKKGECFGIIGRNGSGKSTLLKILAGVLTQTSGSLHIDGKIASILELGSGFNPEMTGKENIYFYSTLLGFSKEQINKVYEDVLEFSDLGEHIFKPIKTYSSGMHVRLAFALQTYLTPDILIIDEALSVGDIFFSQKCSKKIFEMRSKGTTIIFVSHDMATVRNLCNRALYLKNGKAVMVGDVNDVIIEYFKEGGVTSNNSTAEEENDNGMKKEFFNESMFVSNSLLAAGSIETELYSVIAAGYVDKKGIFNPKIKIGDKILFFITLKSKIQNDDVCFSLMLRNSHDQIIFCGGSYNKDDKGINIGSGKNYTFKIEVDLNIECGKYTFEFIVGNAFNNMFNRGVVKLSTPRIPIDVNWDYETEKAPFYGMLGLNYETSYLELIKNN
ncbi:MAG: ABC transporter ATP-binding protein [Bacteriovoracaceae bacterium]